MADANIARLAAALAGRYTVEREIGAGGMATVYLAEDVKHRRQVAVKVLHPDLAQALGAERFLREIEVAARLRHPHILPLYDSGSADGLLYYVMPYAEGETLRARLDRERELPIDDALRIAQEVADALSYAHSHGVVHRDVKPENILLEAGHAVVADFGIAKALHAASEDTALTATGTSVGTPLYMSPEQAAGDSTVDGRSDLYSLACVLYEMLAGQPPFTGANAQAIVRQHLVSTPPLVTQFRPVVPAAVSDALARALSKNPADRFNPVGQFATALSEPARATPAAPAVGASVPAAHVRRPRPMVWGAAALVALAVGAAAVFARGGSVDRDGSSIAVLPFALGSTDTASSGLAAGLHGELVTELTRIPELRVASRGAVLDYAGTAKSQRAIADELNVAAILTGSIQRAGDQVRLTMSLSDPARGEELWAERYDRRLTAENVFALQAEIARAVAGALRLRLAPADSASRPPTTNLAALEFYYRAEALWLGRAGDLDDSLAVSYAERAVALDPQFARAWGLLTHLRAWRVRSGAVVDTMPARQALARVTEVAPGSVEAHLAEGNYRYYARADFAAALTAMEAASRLEPNAANLLGIRALLARRLGRWDEALALQRQAVTLEPGNVLLRTQLTETLIMMRRYEEALASLDRHVALVPTSAFAVVQRFYILMDGVADSAAAKRLVTESRPLLTGFLLAEVAHEVAYHSRDSAAMRAAPIPAPADEALFPNIPNRHLLQAVLALRLGSTRVQLAHADSLGRLARAESARLSTGVDPFGGREVAEINVALADALAGRAAEAVARAEAAAGRLSPERDAVDGGAMLAWLAQVYAIVGRTDDAVRTLRAALAAPSHVGPGELQLDPVWDPLRGDPQFEVLAEGR